MTVAADDPSTRPALEPLLSLLRGRRVAVLTGAGVSTESGIPDYRGPETRRRARNPIQYRDFVASDEGRRRYWARALVGWRRFSTTAPNPAHHALVALERVGALTGLVTQNVDRLHHVAGSDAVVELHGALHDVVCLACGDVSPRQALQDALERLNPRYAALSADMAPDGDAEVERGRSEGGDPFADFQLVSCRRCRGPLKPHVVFFGEGVPKERVDAAWAIVDAAEVLLVVGSSLAVFSGYRFVRGAAKRGQPIAIVNLGESRGDAHAAVRIEGRAGVVLPALAAALASR